MGPSCKHNHGVHTFIQWHINKNSPDSDGFVQTKSRKRKQPSMDTTDISNPPTKRPEFQPLKVSAKAGSTGEIRRIKIPPNRLTPLKNDWLKIFTPIVEQL